MNPLLSAVRSLWFYLTGRLRFDNSRKGWTFTGEEGQTFRVFRYVSLKPGPDQPSVSGAVFIPRFHVAGMGVRANILFSLLPMWFIMGLPGFRSKYWMVNDRTGDFAGYYEWDSLEQAKAYGESFAMRFMTGRSVPESLGRRIYTFDQAPAAPRQAQPDTRLPKF